jgi:CheY-like chemotaxis protein
MQAISKVALRGCGKRFNDARRKSDKTGMEGMYSVATAANTAATSTSSPTAKASVGPIRVLHIEDDPEHADLVKHWLTGDSLRNYSVEWVSELLQALERLAEPGFDVILLDLGMPELGGYKSHVAVRAVAPASPVVVLTGDHRETSREFSLLAGVASYLVKDQTSPRELRRAIRRALL